MTTTIVFLTQEVRWIVVLFVKGHFLLLLGKKSVQLKEYLVTSKIQKCCP